MKPWAKSGVVAGGYAAAFALASVAVYLRIKGYENDPAAQASQGMYAAGDTMLFVFVFGMASLLPTGLALYYLRTAQRFWSVIAACGLALAATGVVAAMLYWAERLQPQWASVLSGWPALAVLRTLGAPLVAAALIVCAALAPFPHARRMLWIAVLCEGAASAPWFFGVALPALAGH